MKIKNFGAVIILLFIIACGGSEKTFQLKVTNNSDFAKSDEFIELSLKEIKTKYTDFNENNFLIFEGQNEIPYQISSDENGSKILFVCNLEAGETKSLEVKYDGGEMKREYKSRVFAGLAPKKENVYYDGKFHGAEFEFVDKYKVPVIHKDHDALFKCEGPTWESDKVGYRFYLDWRNATDIFGKKTSELVLREVGQHDTVASDDSYHHMQEWGMDVFKVGSTLGIGSIAMLNEGKVNMVAKTDSNFYELLSNGPVQAAFKTTYNGWEVGKNKYDLKSYISINAGSRFTKQELIINNDAQNLTTGLAKYEGTNFIEKKTPGGWSYIALYGAQTLVDKNDKLGIALFYNEKDLIEFTEDEINYVVVLKPVEGKVTYYYCAAWEQEPNGITNENDFINYLDNELQKLNNPVKVEY
ncbi:MAG: hypothetical protein A2068_03550 [Ignavibacteria bacterium GWB2_35_6b]|nr:MAG: hypothetical protein A2068_03550 [Ignavibacteria bacterium GWB2_35_6b]